MYFINGSEAAIYLGISESTLRRYKNRNKIFKTEYLISNITNKEILINNSSSVKKRIKLNDKSKIKLSAIGLARKGIAVEIKNIFNGETNKYTTLTLAALALGTSRTAIKKAMDEGRILKKTYHIKFIKTNIEI
jgi:DNA invertase Pin-like site-specific DNA recombinase